MFKFLLLSVTSYSWFVKSELNQGPCFALDCVCGLKPDQAPTLKRTFLIVLPLGPLFPVFAENWNGGLRA